MRGPGGRMGPIGPPGRLPLTIYKYFGLEIISFIIYFDCKTTYQ